MTADTPPLPQPDISCKSNTESQVSLAVFISASSRSLVLGIFSLILPQLLPAAPGTVDPTVDVRAVSPGQVRALAEQSDGKLLIGGDFSTVNGAPRGRVARLHADGSLDTSFDPGPETSDIYDRTDVYSLSMQGDKVLACGFLTQLAGQPASAVARLNANGTRDASFNPPAFENWFDPAAWVAVDRGDGKIVVGGRFSSVGGAPRANLVRLNDNGTVDGTFNPVVNNTVLAAVPISGERWLIGGLFTTVSGIPRPGLARILGNGEVDPSFAAITLPDAATIREIIPLPDGKIIYTGWKAQDYFIGRAFENGGTDPGFRPAGSPGLDARAVLLPGGNLLINGPSGSIPNVANYSLTRLAPDGTAAPVATVPLSSISYDLLARENGSVVVGGSISEIAGQLRLGMGALLPDGTLDPAFHPDITEPSRVRRITPLSSGRWLVTGEFAGVLGSGIRGRHLRISRLTPQLEPDTSFQQPLATGSPWWLLMQAAAEDFSGRVILGGDSNSISNTYPRKITRIGPNGGTDPAFGEVVLEKSDVVRDIVIQPDGQILAGGKITQVNGTTSQAVIRLSSEGVPDTSFKPLVTAAVHDIALESGGRILAGGVNQMKRFQPSGSSDPDFNSSLSLNGNVNAVAALPGQRSLIAGNFTTLNGQSCVRIARLDARGNPDPSFQAGTGADGEILSMQVRSDGEVFIAGNFSHFNGVNRKGIAQLSPDGSLRTSFDPGEGFNGQVDTLALAADGSILAGGSFTRAGGLARSGFAKLEGSALESVPPAPAVPAALTVTPLSSQKMVLIWPDVAGESGYIIERRVAGSTDWLTLARLDADTGFHNDDTVVPGENYEYRILAWNSHGDAPYSAAPEVHTPDRSGLAGELLAGSDLDLWNTGEVTAAAFQTDGKIIIAGNFTRVNGQARQSLARLHPNGTLDTSFNPGTGATGGSFTGNVDVIGIQSTGRIILSGSFTGINGVRKQGLARLLPDGALDTTFTTELDFAGVFGMAVLPDDKIMIGGGFSRVNTTTRPRLARLNADGTPDTSFGNAGITSVVYALAMQADGKVVVAGDISQVGGFATGVARFNTNGTRDITFAAVPLKSGTQNGLGLTIAIQSDGKILLGGGFNLVSNVPRNNLARLNTDGTLDTAFVPGTGPDSLVRCFTELGGGRIAVGGDFQSYNGQARTTWVTLSSSGSLESGPAVAIRGASVRFIARRPEPHNECLVCGNFWMTGGQLHEGLLRLQGDGITPDASFAPQCTKPGSTRSITRQPNGKWLVTGDFTTVGGGFQPSIFRVEVDGSVDNEFSAGTGADRSIFCAATGPDGTIFVGGDFGSIDGVPRKRVAALDATGKVKTSFAPGEGADNIVYSALAEADGGVTFGGSFAKIDGQTRPRLARLSANGLNTGDYGNIPASNGSVLALHRTADGQLLMGGNFSTPSAGSLPYLMKIDQAGTLDPSFTAALNGAVKVIQQGPAGSYYLGGSFSSISGVARAGVARIGASGALDAGFLPQVGAGSTFKAMAIADSGEVYLSGRWVIPNRTPALLRLFPDGMIDRSFDAGYAGADVDALGLPLGRLLAGGTFTSWNGVPKYGLAEIRVNSSLTASAAPGAFTAAGSAGNAVSLAWNASANATGYLLERRAVDSGAWMAVGTTGTNSFSDGPLPPGSRWFYRVTSYNAAGSQSPAAEFEAIVATTYAQWRTQRNIPEATSDNSDDDHDGVPLLMEYALDLSPQVPDAAGLPRAVLANGVMEFHYLHARPDLLYVVEGSTALNGWDDEGVDQGTQPLHRVAKVGMAASKGFLRLNVSLASP